MHLIRLNEGMELPRRNPFAPGYGKQPPVLVGREDIFEDFEDALESPQHPSTALLLLGPRGIGKTVALDRLRDIARTQGWKTVRTSAVQGDWLQALTEAVIADHAEFVGADAKRTITGVSAFGVGVTAEVNDSDEQPTIRFRDALRAYATTLAEHQTGVALIIDEIQTANVDTLRALGDDHQIIAESEQLPVVIAVASLPSLAAELEADNIKATFLQRMDRRTLGRLNTEDTLRAVTEPFVKHGVTFSHDAKNQIVVETRGAPYFAQLLGFQLWKHLRKSPSANVSETAIASAAEKAYAIFGRTVADTLLNDMTPVERTFLMAMAVDAGDVSKIDDIAERMGRDLNYAYQYRHKLIAADVIFANGTKRVSFTDTAIRDHLRTTPQFEEFQRKLTSDITGE